MTRKPRETCPECGSLSLFTGWFDREGYAVPMEQGQDTPEGVEWTTYCQDCGCEVDVHNGRTPNR
jgi:hypothetical protein